MARIGITYSDLAKAAADLAAAGKNPTVDSVREVLGSGSKSTIAPLLKRWKAEHETQRSVVEVGLPPALLQSVKQLYQSLQEEANQRIDAAHAALAEAKAGFEATGARAEAVAAGLSEERNALQAQLQSERTARDALHQNHQVLQLAVATTRTELAGASQRLQDRQREIDHLLQQLTQLRAQFEHYQDASASRQQEERRAGEQVKVHLEQTLAQLQQAAANCQAILRQRDMDLAQAHADIARMQSETARREQQKKRPRRLPRRR